ncbi:phenylalanine--tRNA ligase subunit beta [Lachnobacterium bovis]|uniref:phenylalanine--tRNA ligase subunit beta n=1 Tax=Lachnobacterium bovis TaxID=140626 RepID=UPI000482C980|nr:phenylalanine--tRNA ligase subunit beta [Lachnobacterium bovis]
MNTSLNWIKDLVPDLECTDQEYMDAMTLSGTKVEQGVRLDKDLEKIVIGKVEKIEQHPDADKLVICQVNIGEEELIQIVTGAPNVFEGAKVPVVLDGGRVAGGHDGKLVDGGVKIKKGKLRGVESFGMMCSIDELGSTTEMFPNAAENGLYILPDDAPVGQSAIEYLGLDDLIVEYEVTSNRVDCFSVLGIAREAAATFDKKFVPPVITEVGNDEDVNDYIKVKVENNELCKRYVARVVKNVKFAPSPEWMQKRLRAQGIRPINNLVDITNYVMEEMGQPMHAYDLSTIAGREIIVDTAKNGQEFITLDGQTRVLDSNTLTINDAQKQVGIAGIMGGENSMITENVKDVLFEAACFDGTNIRLSSKKLGMRTDASSKFEKGLDPNLALDAMNRACQLIEELGVGEVVGGAIDIYPVKREGVNIPFEPEKYNKLLGTDIDKETMISYLEKIDLVYNSQTNEIEVPSWRQDLLCDADIAEEVVRFYGYDKIPTTLPNGQSTVGKISFKHHIEKIVKSTVEHCGFSQAMTYSFESPKVYDKLLLDENDEARKAIKIANPLGEDYSIMRTLSVNGMMTSLSTNFGRRNKDVRLYELGNVYLPKQLPITELPDEKMKLTLGMYGEGDFFDMKGFVEEIFEAVGMRKKVEYSPESNLNYLHPGRQANIIYDGKVIGYLGEVHPVVASNYAIKDRVYVAVLDMELITANASFDYKYKQIVNFPASTRDLSMVVPREILVGDIEKVFDQRGGQYLESYKLFDVYEGEQIKEGFKSVAYSLVFRGKEKNLEENDIAKAMKKILNGLEDLGIELRA